jgi:uncharacterized protein HemX
MKNPFIKNESGSKNIVAALIIGAVAAGAIVYFYYNRKKELANSAAQAMGNATDYLKTKHSKKKKHKTNVNELTSLVAN